MATCEKCWADAGGDAEKYHELLKSRMDNPCSPEEWAGPEALNCPQCNRKTVHQHTGKCVLCLTGLPSMDVTEQQLAAWEALAAAATEGPWEPTYCFFRNWEGKDYWYACQRHHLDAEKANADAKLIAAARTAMPALCKEVRRLRKELEARKDEPSKERDDER